MIKALKAILNQHRLLLPILLFLLLLKVIVMNALALDMPQRFIIQ